MEDALPPSPVGPASPTDRTHDENIDDGTDNGNTIIQWEYERTYSWEPFYKHHQPMLETAWKNYTNKVSDKHVVRLMAGKFRYDVDIDAMSQQNVDHWNHRQRHIRRTLNR